MKSTRPQIRTTWKSNWLLELSAAFIILGVLAREPLLAAVGILVSVTLALLALRFYWNLAAMHGRLQVDSQLPRSRISLGETAEGILKVRNGANFAANVHMIRSTADEGLRLQFQGTFDELVPPNDEATFSFTITPLRRGRFQITSFSLVLADSRYLFAAEVGFEKLAWLEVFPGTIQPLTPLALYAGGSERLRRTPVGVDYAGIREYTTGDEYHRVEWKATARLRRLMVKEFHPETQTNLQILIDTGRTMRQQSYVGTRLDEALVVAQLLVQAATKLEKSVGAYFYDETHIIKSLKAVENEQLIALSDFTPPKSSMRSGTAVSFSKQFGIARFALPQNSQVIAYLQLLKRNLWQGYRNAGVYKAIREATSANRESLLVVLTDLESNVDALLEAASTQNERAAKIIVSQIGAAWRLTLTLEQGYSEYQRNAGDLRRLQSQGLTAIDVRPEQLLETIVNSLGRSLMITSGDSRT